MGKGQDAYPHRRFSPNPEQAPLMRSGELAQGWGEEEPNCPKSIFGTIRFFLCRIKDSCPTSLDQYHPLIRSQRYCSDCFDVALKIPVIP